MAGKITERKQVITDLIAKLKNNSIGFYGVPEEYRYNPEIVKTQRNLGLRKSAQRGYDVLHGWFFVAEIIVTGESFDGEKYTSRMETIFFDFASYYKFLQGDIYENACYYQYCFSQAEIDKFSIDLEKINFNSIIDYSIDDYTLNLSQKELQKYELKENQKRTLISTLDTLCSCQTYAKFRTQIESLEDEFEGVIFGRSLMRRRPTTVFFLSNYIYKDKTKAFDFAMKYVNSTSSFDFEKSMCLIYEPQQIVTAYNNIYYGAQTAKKYKKELQQFVENLERGNIEFLDRSFFDEQTHFFVHQRVGIDANKRKVADLFQYFKTFDELAEYLSNDLSCCDLSKAIIPNLDLSKYKTNEDTILPITYQKNLTYSLTKSYDRTKDYFVVEQNWTTESGKVVKAYRHSFRYFFDFLHFLKKDLSDADLLFCNELRNLSDFSGINLYNAKLDSVLSAKLGIQYDVVQFVATESFPNIERNEKKSKKALAAQRERYSYEETLNSKKIYYISDLHLIHKIQNAKCKSINDVTALLQNVIDNLLADTEIFDRNILLINGDTSSDFAIFKQFITMLRKSIDAKRLKLKVVFTLGNHDLWDFATFSIDEIVEKYKGVITANGMQLLHNNILYLTDERGLLEISCADLTLLSQEEIKKSLSRARVILFGGIGFAGYNDEFNANVGIYRKTLNREQETEETYKFEALYKKVCDELSDKRIVVVTHMPLSDCCSNKMPQKGFVYINGHTHRNYFHDDGDYRIYADNQIGYNHASTRLKYFYLEDDYDIFSDYEDGIYEISRNDYLDFNRGKNITITFNRDFHKLYLLKKNTYYMFILQSYNGKVQVLNGGSVKTLSNNDVNYYFDNMDRVIANIETPLSKLTEYQQQISKVIKSIGGSGTIHGAIVDIDYFNHIYVNPLDLTITPYYALDIVRKVVFADIPTLLQSNCPALYTNYLKQIESDNSTALVLQTSETKKPIRAIYLDTDIYRASREIKKMQKLHVNILTVWNEPLVKKISGSND